jgi:hypothetical protein
VRPYGTAPVSLPNLLGNMTGGESSVHSPGSAYTLQLQARGCCRRDGSDSSRAADVTEEHPSPPPSNPPVGDAREHVSLASAKGGVDRFFSRSLSPAAALKQPAPVSFCGLMAAG